MRVVLSELVASDGDLESRYNNNTRFFVKDGTLIRTGGTSISDLDVVLTNTQPIDVQSGAIRVRRPTSFTDADVTVAAGAESVSLQAITRSTAPFR